MSAISQKSITGITSITTPAGVDNQLTLHNNNTTEAVKLDVAGNVHINNQLAVTGVSTLGSGASGQVRLDYQGNQRLKTHTWGVEVSNTLSATNIVATAANSSFAGASFTGAIDANGDLDVDGHTNLDNVSIAGITTFSGTGIRIANATNPFIHLKDTTNNTDSYLSTDDGGSLYLKADDNQEGSSTKIVFQLDGSEKVHITSGGSVNIGGNFTQTSKKLYVDGTIEATSNFTCVNQIYLNGTAPQIVFTDTNQDSDYTIKNDFGSLQFIDRTNSNAVRLYANTGGFGGDRLYIADDIVHTGDTDTKIEFGTDTIIFDTAGSERVRIDSNGKVLINSSTVTASYGGKLQVTNTNFAMNSFANNQHAQTLLFAKSRHTSGSGGTIVGSGDFCGHIEWYADDGENTENQIAKISGQMDGSPGVNDTPGKLLFYTTVDGANASTLRMQISSGGVVHIGSTAVSNTIPTGGLDLQGNNTNCVLEMGNPLPNYSAGRVPTFKITTRDPDKAVDFASMWGGDNGIWKHMTLAGGATIFYNGTNDTEIVRITGSALMVGTTSNSANTQAKGIALNNDGAMISRRDGVMHYYKSIATGGYYANVFMSANTTVGSIFFNSGGTQFNTSSDYRRKENVVSLTDGISKLKQLKPYRFNFKDNPSETVDGFLAHEAQEIVPHTVTGTKDQVSTSKDVDAGIATTVGEPIYQQMDLSKLVPLLTAALQDEILKREALEVRVAALEGS